MDEQPKPHHQTFLIAAIIIVLLLLGGIFIALYRGKESQIPVTPSPALKAPSPQPPPSQPLPPVSIPVPTTEVVPDAITNPVQDLPSANPFEAETNPFESAYKNPFE